MDKFTRALIFSLFMALAAFAVVGCDTGPGEPGDDQDIITGQDAVIDDSQKTDNVNCGPYGCVNPEIYEDDSGGSGYCEGHHECPEGWVCRWQDNTCTNDPDSVVCTGLGDCPANYECYLAEHWCYELAKIEPYLWLNGDWRQILVNGQQGDMELDGLYVHAWDKTKQMAIMYGIASDKWWIGYEGANLVGASEGGDLHDLHYDQSTQQLSYMVGETSYVYQKE